MGEQLVADGGIGEWDFQSFAGASHSLNEVGPAHDADELAVLYDRHPFDGVLLQ